MTTTSHTLAYGPRLVARPTGRLRAALLIEPTRSIEQGKPLIGEPGAVYERAYEQHVALRKLLTSFGVETFVMEPRSHDPYEVAVADAAVLVENGAVVMRPTVLSRRGEADRMEAEFARIDVPIAGRIEAPGLLDGGDVMLAGTTAFIGVGSRGNDLGRAGFTQVARAHGYRPVEVRLAPGVPSLRAVAGAVAEDTIVLGAESADPQAFAGFRTIVLERGEERAAGVLCIDERHAIADIRYRTALSAMRRSGIALEAIDLYEFGKLGITPSMLVLALKRD